MSSLYGRPTAAELVAAVADFLDSDVARSADAMGRSPSTPGSPRTCCAPSSANCSTRPRARSPRRLDELGFADETQLAAAIRAGELDGRAGEVLPCLRTLVRHRLAIAHPGYDEESEFCIGVTLFEP